MRWTKQPSFTVRLYNGSHIAKKHYRLTLADALSAHERALRTGGRDGVPNPGLVESAICRPYSGYYPHIWQKAAALAQSMSGSQPHKAIFDKLSDAIERCAAYKAVAGNFVYSGGSGPVLTADLMAPYLFQKGDGFGDDRNISSAVDWLLRLLATREAAGIFKAAIWGFAIDNEVNPPYRCRSIRSTCRRRRRAKC